MACHPQPPGHVGRIRTYSTKEDMSCLLNTSAVQSVSRAPSSAMGSSMNGPTDTLNFLESCGFGKELYDYRCSESRNSLVKYFCLMAFGSYLLQLGAQLFPFCSILCIKKYKRTFHAGLADVQFSVDF